jgi:23S rRNA (cytidine1920-2'-O)/16S rRNA (cytidine1409-2'-O)-methyltransferase
VKKRLDVLLVERGFYPSREKAQAAIMAGQVYVFGERSGKAGDMVDSDTPVEVRGPAIAYVSRGGLKLEKALDVFSIDLRLKTCLDIGASTGGFTDCMLQKGAARVFAVDVGYGQLAWALRSDSRVVCLERTNFRYVKPEDIGEPIDFATADVSFISLSLILPPARSVLREDGQMVCLVKPQFEAGRGKVGKKGVVRDPAVHLDVLRKTCETAVRNRFSVLGLSWSPIRGPEGNIEYLMWLSCESRAGIDFDTESAAVVLASHGDGGAS